MRIWVIVKDT